jgi:hypothetical protein
MFDVPQLRCGKCQSADVQVETFLRSKRVDPSNSRIQALVGLFMILLLGLGIVYSVGGQAIPLILALWIGIGGLVIAGFIYSEQQTRYDCTCRHCGNTWHASGTEMARLTLPRPPVDASPRSPASLILLLTARTNRGYVIAGSGALVGFIVFLFTLLLRGSTGSLVWVEGMSAFIVGAVSALLLLGRQPFGPEGPLVETVRRYDRYWIIGGGMAALFVHLLIFFDLLGLSRFGYSSLQDLGPSYWVFLLAAIAMIIGGLLARAVRSYLRIVLFYGFMAVVIVGGALVVLFLIALQAS